MTPRWVTAFLDYPPDLIDAATGFWSTVTGHHPPGHHLSGRRGEHDQYVPLEPPDGHSYLWLQRLGEGPVGVHMDLHVADLQAATREAESLGATVVGSPADDLTTFRSPGGLPFCLVVAIGGDRPQPVTWPGGHTSYVDQVCLDVPPSRYDAELDFWAGLTGWRRRDPAPGSEFGRVTPDPGQPLLLLVQRLDDEQDTVTAHLDWSASDHEAEVERHVAAGAERGRSFAGWTVLRDPAGMTYCITRRMPGAPPA